MAATELTYTHLRITDFESSSGALRQTVAGTSVSQSLVTSSEAIGISYLVLDGLEVGLALSVGSINAGGGVDVALGPSLSVFFDDHLYLGLEAAARALYFNDLTENPFDAIQQPGDGDHRLTAFPLVGLEVGLRVGFAIPLTRWLELAPEVRLQAMPLILAQNDVKVTFYSCPDGGTCAQGDTRSPASMLALGGTAALNVRAKF